MPYRWKGGGLFGKLKQGERGAASLWEQYTSYLAIAVNNIHMVLDCDIVLGGYVGSCIGTHIQELWDKVAKRNTFEEKEPYVKACNL